MTCRKIRQILPLAAGDDLGPRRARAVRAHLEACPACRHELEELRQALAEFKAEARREAVPDWSAAEWKALMVRATQGARGRREDEGAFGARKPWPRWAVASALGVLVGFAVLSLLFKGPESGPEGAVTAGRAGEPVAGRGQDHVSMTIVSQETGLQIVWFLDKNFDYKGEHE